LAVDRDRWWGDKGKVFTVGFMDNPNNATRSKILQVAKAWSAICNVDFVEASDPIVRITRDRTGYWSYLGTDILGIPRGEATMNLQGFTEHTSDAEYARVVKHEVGHTMGFPHEHMRPELVAKLDVNKTIQYFKRNQGWNRNEVIAQVLTPLNEASIRGTPQADDTSIMCYQLPGSITKDGLPIRGGDDINQIDADFIATIYPKAVVIPPPGGGELPKTFTGTVVINGVTYTGVFTRP
jgi:hypothetical protein